MAKDFFSRQEQDEIVEAIRLAELETSGEIRVHIEERCPIDPIDRAREVFFQLGMNHTKEQNGVVIYLALLDKKFAILGDKGLHEKVTDQFWEEEKQLMLSFFQQGKFTEGLCAAVSQVGEKLQAFFPYHSEDKNELSNEVSFGGNSHE